MKTKFIPIVVAVSLITVSSFLVFANVVVATQLDRDHHDDLLPNHPFLLIPQAFALCEANVDWPDRPCYACVGCYSGLEGEKLNWIPYYDFKGKQIMESKKQEMLSAIQDRTLSDWIEQSQNHQEHQNIHNYYFLNGEVPNLDGLFFDKALQVEQLEKDFNENPRVIPQSLWVIHETIIDGTVIDTIEDGESLAFSIKVNKVFKGTTNSDLITAIASNVWHDFLIGDSGLFYIYKINPVSSIYQYMITPYSVRTSENCDARSFIEISPTLPNEKPSITGGPAGPIPSDPCVPKYFDEDPDAKFSTNKKIIPPPLQQLKLGVKTGLIVCDDDKILVYNVHYKPACVFEESEMKLIKNGWAKLRLLLPASPFPANEMELTGRNVMSMMLEGTVTIGENRLETYDEKRAAVWEYAQEYYPGETFLEYSIVFPPHDRHYYQGDEISFDLLGWGNYADCWDLNVRIFDTSGYVLYEDNLSKGCQEPPSTPGTFNSYSIGKDMEEIICEKPGFYMIEVSNGDIYPATILQNFACLQ